jgi:hypothetical protein
MQGKHIRSIGFCMGRVGVCFNEDAIGADGNTGAGNRLN